MSCAGGDSLAALAVVKRLLQWQQAGRPDPAAPFHWPADGLVTGPLAVTSLRRFSLLRHYAAHLAPHLPRPGPASPVSEGGARDEEGGGELQRGPRAGAGPGRESGGLRKAGDGDGDGGRGRTAEGSVGREGRGGAGVDAGCGQGRTGCSAGYGGPGGGKEQVQGEAARVADGDGGTHAWRGGCGPGSETACGAGGGRGGKAGEGGEGGGGGGGEESSGERWAVQALYRAAGRGRACVVEALLRAGVDPDGRPAPPRPLADAPSTGGGGDGGAARGPAARMTTPLHMAAAGGHAAAAAALIEGGARVRAANAGGALALHLAAGGGAEVLRVVMGASGWDGAARARDGNRKTAVHYAARSGQAECIRMLVGSGGDVAKDVDAVDKWNRQVRAADT